MPHTVLATSGMLTPRNGFVAGVVSALLNVPFGAMREHTAKFSPEWFLAVHATIPLIAPLRKAVLMPRWAIALTLLSAIAGQQAGARLERARVASGGSLFGSSSAVSQDPDGQQPAVLSLSGLLPSLQSTAVRGWQSCQGQTDTCSSQQQGHRVAAACRQAAGTIPWLHAGSQIALTGCGALSV